MGRQGRAERLYLKVRASEICEWRMQLLKQLGRTSSSAVKFVTRSEKAAVAKRVARVGKEVEMRTGSLTDTTAANSPGACS
jgi:tRNA U34 5-methylaminomethyl-2-thiouridine-forming methyltransferase MnmC